MTTARIDMRDFSPIAKDEQGREYVIHVPSGVRYLVKARPAAPVVITDPRKPSPCVSLVPEAPHRIKPTDAMTALGERQARLRRITAERVQHEGVSFAERFPDPAPRASAPAARVPSPPAQYPTVVTTSSSPYPQVQPRAARPYARATFIAGSAPRSRS